MSLKSEKIFFLQYNYMFFPCRTREIAEGIKARIEHNIEQNASSVVSTMEPSFKIIEQKIVESIEEVFTEGTNSERD